MKITPHITDTFAQKGTFFKGNIHTHSNRSDGALSPHTVCAHYKAAGYDFVAITDHFVGTFDYPLVDTSGMRDADFTTLFGAELHSGAMQNGEIWHIVAVGLPLDFKPSNSPGFSPVADQETGAEIARRARDAGAFVTMVHPQWSGLSLEDARSIKAAHAVEIYNHGAARHSDRPDGMNLYETMLNHGDKLSLTASDDAHFHCPDYFGAFVMVKAEQNTPQTLLDALKKGHYYASQGPQFHHIEIRQNKLLVHCSEVDSVVVAGEKLATNSVHGTAMTEIELDLSRHQNCSWLRVTLIDKDFKRAWSNPIFAIA